MKKLHLIANAHIDPIWLWEWQEGLTAGLSTFQSALNLADEYDYIFCHNEALLYQYVEEYAPAMFEKIKQLVECGKWHIMGGWYNQPDCTMPSGESFVRQVKMGQKYFQDKFGVKSNVALNFDSFGHSRGIVQIIAKCGQDSYMFHRPAAYQMELPNDQFIWEGFDGSQVKAARLPMGYGSLLGEAVQWIKDRVALQNNPVGIGMWGVGNHGGGPSRKDLADIAEYIKEEGEKGVEVLHSTPSAFFADINPTDVVDQSLFISMPGCYVSMSRVKRAHAELENQLYFAEKICSVAAMKGLMEYPHEDFKAITEDLMYCEFHDVLPGTCIQAGEENALRQLHRGRMNAERLWTKAFFALLKEEETAEPETYPIYIFNPHPYELETQVECEFILANQNWSDTDAAQFDVYDRDGNLCEYQIIKEESCLNLDWRKRLAIACKLEPMSINRFVVKTHMEPIREKVLKDNWVFENGQRTVEIDPKTGLLKRYCVGGKEYIHDGFLPITFADNADPWAMSLDQLKRIGAEEGVPFSLCEKPNGVFGNLQSIEVIEDGDVLTAIEAFFEQEHNKVRVEYRIYKKQTYVDVNVTVFWQDIDKILRLAIPASFKGQYIGQAPFGTEQLFMDGRENTSQRFVALQDGDDCLAIFNNGTYGSKFENDTIYISLLRGAGYAVHPINERPLMPENHFVKRIDQGEHRYAFRIDAVKTQQLERMALEFNQKPYALNAYPVSSEFVSKINAGKVSIDNKDIALVAMKQSVDGDKYVLRLINNSRAAASAKLTVDDKSIDLNFGRYEVKTVVYDKVLTEQTDMII